MVSRQNMKFRMEMIKVNGEVDQRRGRKVYVGDVITFDGQEIKVIK